MSSRISPKLLKTYHFYSVLGQAIDKIYLRAAEPHKRKAYIFYTLENFGHLTPIFSTLGHLKQLRPFCV